MSDSMLNNVMFKLTGKLTTSGTSVVVSNDLERDLVIAATGASVVLKNADGTIIERMQCDFAAGTMTIIKRGLDQSETKTEVAGLKKEWGYGTDGYVTVFGSDMLDVDSTGGVKALNGDLAFGGDNSHSGAETFTNTSDVKIQGKSNPQPNFATEVARDAFYTAPVNGDKCTVNGIDYSYNGTTAQWEAKGVSTPVPNASTTAGGIVKIGTALTDADQVAGLYNVTPNSVVKSYVDNRTQYKFGGTEADGVQGDSNLTITGSDNTIIEKNFSSWTAGSVARVCTITPINCITYIKIKGDADFTNWTFNFAAKGPDGGPASTGGGTVSGTTGTDSISIIGISNKGGLGASAVGGGGGAGYGANGLTAAGGAAGGAKSTDYSPIYIQTKKSIRITCGAGGGSGGEYNNSTGGKGGHGGGALIIEVGGNIVFSSTVITVAGENGADGAVGGGYASGGGGGGGGTAIVIYNGTKTGTCTPVITGGTGGAKAGSGGGTVGGDGGVGYQSIEKNTTWF